MRTPDKVLESLSLFDLMLVEEAVSLAPDLPTFHQAVVRAIAGEDKAVCQELERMHRDLAMLHEAHEINREEAKIEAGGRVMAAHRRYLLAVD